MATEFDGWNYWSLGGSFTNNKFKESMVLSMKGFMAHRNENWIELVWAFTFTKNSVFKSFVLHT